VLKNPHTSKRVGHVVPSAVVWPSLTGGCSYIGLTSLYLSPLDRIVHEKLLIAISISPIIHLVCPQNFAQAISLVSLGMTVIPRRNGKQRLCRILGGKQGVLWGMWEWLMTSLLDDLNRPFWCIAIRNQDCKALKY